MADVRYLHLQRSGILIISIVKAHHLCYSHTINCSKLNDCFFSTRHAVTLRIASRFSSAPMTPRSVACLGASKLKLLRVGRGAKDGLPYGRLEARRLCQPHRSKVDGHYK